MKKLISLSLVLFLIFSGLMPVAGVITNSVPPAQTLDQTAQTLAPINVNSLVKTQNFSALFMPAAGIWKNKIANIPQNSFHNVTYTLNDNVVNVSNAVVQDIKSAADIINHSADQTRAPMSIISEGAFIDKGVLDAAAATTNIQPGTVFFDESSKTAFKLVTPIDAGEADQGFTNTYSLIKPQIHEIVKDFNLPKQSVMLDEANITGFAATGTGNDTLEKYIVDTPVVADQAYTGGSIFRNLAITRSKYSVLDLAESNFLQFKHLDDPLIQFMFPKDTQLTGYLGNGQSVVVTINGGLGLGDVNLDGSYSGFDGYTFGLSISQEAFLQVSVAINIQQEVRIPIIGLDIPFGIGRVSGGLFLVVNIDGNLTIELQAREWTTCTAGVGGGTFLYVPTSVGPYFDMPKKGISGDVSIDGKINGTIKAGALLSVEILGWDLVGAGAFIGAGLNVASDGTMLDVELYGLVQVYIAFLGDQYNLVDFKVDVFRRQQKDMGGYRVKIQEADAYMKRVGGMIEYDYGQAGRKPEPGVQFQIRVTPSGGGAPVIYKPDNGDYYVTDSYGEFIVYNVDLYMNDTVEVLLVDKNTSQIRESGPASPTFPFKAITVNDSDYFNDFIVGQVTPVMVRNWGVHTGVAAEEYSTLYYQGDVTIRLMTYKYGQTTTEQTVTTTSDGFGSFRAQNELATDGNAIDVRPATTFGLSIKKYGFLVSDTSNTEPKVLFELKRVTDPIDGSNTRFNEGSKVVDQSAVNERYYIINMRGTRQLTGASVSYKVMGFSTQDKLKYHFIYWTPSFGFSNDYEVAYKYADDMLTGMYPSTSNLILTPDAVEDGTSYLNNKIVRQWVWQPHSNPTVITSAAKYSSPPGGGKFQVTATGVAPIGFSLENAPAGVTINSGNGLMTIAGSVAPGGYTFEITATASAPTPAPGTIDQNGEFPAYQEDAYPPVKQNFTLSVLESGAPTATATSSAPPATATAAPTSSASPTPAPTPTPTPAADAAPTITSNNGFSCSMTGGIFQVAATGKAPIAYSLSSLSPVSGLPSQITINASTGLITIIRGLSAGQYQFYVNASNGISPDAKQLFTFTLQPLTTSLGFMPDLAVITPANLASIFMQMVVKPNSTNSTQNTIVLRNDDPKDLYSNKMVWVDGAEYIKWDGVITLSIEGERTQLIFFDNSPMTDHHLTHLTQKQKQAAISAIDELGKTKYLTDNGFNLADGLGASLAGTLGTTKALDYGSALDKIKNSSGGGPVRLSLGGNVGTLVPGDIFTGLKKKSGVKISLDLDGASVVFVSSEVGKVKDNDLYDFAYISTAPSDPLIRQKLPNDASAFTYAFAHNGKLPGYGHFSIATGMPAGASVNVYKFDAETAQFSIIAKGLKVAADGMVTYKNNTTSEYVITTGTIAGAVKAPAYYRQGAIYLPDQWWFWLICGLLLLALAGGAFWRFMPRKKRAVEPSGEIPS